MLKRKLFSAAIPIVPEPQNIHSKTQREVVLLFLVNGVILLSISGTTMCHATYIMACLSLLDSLVWARDFIWVIFPTFCSTWYLCDYVPPFIIHDLCYTQDSISPVSRVCTIHLMVLKWCYLVLVCQFRWVRDSYPCTIVAQVQETSQLPRNHIIFHPK